MPRLLIVGAGDWDDREAMARYLARLPRDSELRLGGAGVVNEMAAILADKLGLPAMEHAGWDARRAPGVRARALISEVQPAAVLAFTDRIIDQRGEFTGTGHVIHMAICESIRVTVCPPSKGRIL